MPTSNNFETWYKTNVEYGFANKVDVTKCNIFGPNTILMGIFKEYFWVHKCADQGVIFQSSLMYAPPKYLLFQVVVYRKADFLSDLCQHSK